MTAATISKAVATDIVMAWREIETAEALLVELTKLKARYDATDIRDAFGRRQDGLKLGVPSGDHSHQLFNVPWSLAVPIIEAHVSAQRALLATLSAKALIEAAA